MQRIIYISTARNLLTPAAISQVLATSRRNNAASGVTGLLVIGGRRFLQTLEGPDAAVETTYQRILADPRHFAVVALSRKTIGERAFGQWSMGHLAGADTGGDEDLRVVVERLLAPIADPTIRAYFTDFAARHAAA